MRRSHGTLISLAVLVTLTIGCGSISSVTFGHSGGSQHRSESAHRPGPPPHAPAHGYRHKHRHRDGRSVDLVFDSGLGVYLVVGVPDRYYWNGSYLRLDGDQWFVSVSPDSGWERRDEEQLPPGLHKKHKRAKKGNGHKSKKSHPAKGKW